MEMFGLITKAMPVKKNEKGEWVRNPRVITDRFVDDMGNIVYGDFKMGPEAKKALELLKTLKTDFSLLDAYIEKMVWTLANLMPLCLMKSVESIRTKKKFFWDSTKVHATYWLAANMNTEAWLGFNAFNTQSMTGTNVIDFIKYRQLVAQGHLFDDELADAVIAKPKE